MGKNNAAYLKKISGIISQLKELSILKSPEAKALIERIGSSRIEELPKEDVTAGMLLYGFAQYQNVVCDLVDTLTAMQGDMYPTEEQAKAAQDQMQHYRDETVQIRRRYDEDIETEKLLSLFNNHKSPQQMLEETADQWDRLTQKLAELSAAISEGESITDVSNALVWQCSLFPKSIALNGEAAKFSRMFNALIANVEIGKTAKSTKPETLS